VFIPNSYKSGLRQFTPRQSVTHKFCESIDIGWTPLSLKRIMDLVVSLAAHWPSNSYHVIRRNCHHFAESLIDALGLHQQFPQWLKGATETALKFPGLAPLLDMCWECTKCCIVADPLAFDCQPCKFWRIDNDAPSFCDCQKYVSVDQVSRLSDSFGTFQERTVEEVMTVKVDSI